LTRSELRLFQFRHKSRVSSSGRPCDLPQADLRNDEEDGRASGIGHEVRAAAEPYYLGRGWAGFDFEKVFGSPTTVVNDAFMQALGSYEGGKSCFLGWERA
jgi:hypothetical protein